LLSSEGERAVPVPQLLVHDHADNVGVVVVEGLEAGANMLCVVTADNSDFHLTAKQSIPIGHKVALKDLAVGDSVVKYGQDIGRVVQAVTRGEHVHVHNLKTRRW
jgi:(2R)-sulfolactate sulfo-lyase subunit alpha